LPLHAAYARNTTERRSPAKTASRASRVFGPRATEWQTFYLPIGGESGLHTRNRLVAWRQSWL